MFMLRLLQKTMYGGYIMIELIAIAATSYLAYIFTNRHIEIKRAKYKKELAEKIHNKAIKASELVAYAIIKFNDGNEKSACEFLDFAKEEEEKIINLVKEYNSIR